MSKYKFNIKCGAKLTSVEIEADTYEDALKEVKKQAIRFKGNKVDTKFDKNKLDTRDASGIHKITYVDVDGNKTEETIKGDPNLVNKRVSELKNHDCKILKTEMFLNWKRNVKDSNNTDKYNDEVVNKLKKVLESKKSLHVSFEDYAGTGKDFEKAIEKANLKYKNSGGGNYVVTKDSDVNLKLLEWDLKTEVLGKKKGYFYVKEPEEREFAENWLSHHDFDWKVRKELGQFRFDYFTTVKDSKLFYVKYVDSKSNNGKELIKYFKDVNEAKKFIDLDGKDIIVKASNITTKDSELAWQEFNNSDRIVTKRKQFKSKEEMQKFLNKVAEKDNFYRVLATRDSKPFEVDKTIMHEKDANGKMLYLVKSGSFYVTTTDPTGHGGGIFDVNLKNAQETFKSNLLMTKLEKKYGKQEAYKRYLAGATDASVTVNTDPWSRANSGKKPRGYGNWAFAYSGNADINDVFFFNGNFEDCKKKAIEKAKSEGKTTIYVLS